jgi:hypothetical protein
MYFVLERLAAQIAVTNLDSCHDASRFRPRLRTGYLGLRVSQFPLNLYKTCGCFVLDTSHHIYIRDHINTRQNGPILACLAYYSVVKMEAYYPTKRQ